MAGSDQESRAQVEVLGRQHVIKRLSFVFYGETGRPCLRVYDARSGDLLKEIPPGTSAEDIARQEAAAAARAVDIKV